MNNILGLAILAVVLLGCVAVVILFIRGLKKNSEYDKEELPDIGEFGAEENQLPDFDESESVSSFAPVTIGELQGSFTSANDSNSKNVTEDFPSVGNIEEPESYDFSAPVERIELPEEVPTIEASPEIVNNYPDVTEFSDEPVTEFEFNSSSTQEDYTEPSEPVDGFLGDELENFVPQNTDSEITRFEDIDLEPLEETVSEPIAETQVESYSAIIDYTENYAEEDLSEDNSTLERDIDLVEEVTIPSDPVEEKKPMTRRERREMEARRAERTI